MDGTSTIDAVNSLIGLGSGYLLQQVVGLPGGTSFLASFSGNGGSVIAVQLSASAETYATAATQNLTLSPSFIEATLDTGTAVVLQASNDLTVNSPIVVDNPSGNGDLTLQAGRSILLNASITTDNGNLTLIANDTAADGVVNSQRQSGPAVITLAAGATLDAGTGTLTILLSNGAGNTSNASGGITLAGVLNVGGTTSLTAAAPVTVNNSANTFTGTVSVSDPGGNVTLAASGNMTLSSTTAPATLTASAGGTLAASGALGVTGAASFTGGTITLTNSGNNFQGLVSLSSTGSISLCDASALALGDLTLAGSTTLNAPSVTFTGALNVGDQALSLGSTGAAHLNGDTTLAGGTVSDSSGLAVGAGATLSGFGTLDVGTGADGVLAQTGATLAPSVSSGLTIDGDLTLALASVLDVQAQSATQYSLLNVTGSVTLTDPTLLLAFENSYSPALADRLTIVNNEGSHAVSGMFIQGSSTTVAGVPLTINYAGGTGNSVVLNQTLPPLPVANIDMATLPENSPATAINVLAHDSGTGLHISIPQGQGPQHGTVVITGGGTGLTYQPTSQFIGADTFSYTITDIAGATSTATVVVLVTGVNQPPIVTVPGDPDFVADKPLLITGISATDPQIFQGPGMSTVVQTTLSVQTGTLTLNNAVVLPNLTFSQGTGTNNSTMVFTGTLDYVNLALASVTYLAAQDTAQPDTLTVTVNNMGNFGAGGPTSVTKTLPLTPATGVFVVADPTLAGKQDLIIQGRPAGGDVVSVVPGKTAGSFVVTFNGVVQPTVTGVTGRILLFDANGNNTITLKSTMTLPALFFVGDGNNTLVGDAGADKFTAGNGTNTITGGAGNDTFTVGNGTNTLTGGAGNDTFTVGTGSNRIDGGGGTNKLIESGDVNFTLVGGTGSKNGSLSKGAFTDTLVLNHIQQVQLTVTGSDNHTINGTAFAGTETVLDDSTGNDTLLAGNGNDILVGGSGNDRLVAGTGMNLLIAGGGADTLVGGPNQDLLIGGSTTFDTNVTALGAIMAEWASSAGYATKIKQLTSIQTGSKNGSTLLTVATVLNNGQASTLTGGKGLDWFWSSSEDTITDLNNGGTETKSTIP